MFAEISETDCGDPGPVSDSGRLKMIPRGRLRDKRGQMPLNNPIFIPEARLTEKRREKLGAKVSTYVKRQARDSHRQGYKCPLPSGSFQVSGPGHVGSL